jgi:hypothetical protein
MTLAARQKRDDLPIPPHGGSKHSDHEGRTGDP